MSLSGESLAHIVLTLGRRGVESLNWDPSPIFWATLVLQRLPCRKPCIMYVACIIYKRGLWGCWSCLSVGVRVPTERSAAKWFSVLRRTAAHGCTLRAPVLQSGVGTSKTAGGNNDHNSNNGGDDRGCMYESARILWTNWNLTHSYVV